MFRAIEGNAARVRAGFVRCGATVGMAVALLGLVAPGATHAGVLGPSKPSQLVTLSDGGARCGDGAAAKLDLQTNGDATFTAFTIPAGTVLVLTDVEWLGYGLTAGATSAFVTLENGAQENLISVGGAPTQNPSGNGGGSFVVSGVVVKPGTDICVGVIGGGLVRATAHGFLANDR